MKVVERETLLAKPPADHTYVFGALQTDYMLDIDYDIDNGGWQGPRIVPHEPFQMTPTNTGLQYAIQCFEGLKAYKTKDKRVLLFRPEKNMERMNSSHVQLGLPSFDVDAGVECMR